MTPISIYRTPKPTVRKKLGFVGDNADGSIGTYGVEFTRTDYDGTTCGLGDGAGDGRGDRDDGGDGGGD